MLSLGNIHSLPQRTAATFLVLTANQIVRIGTPSSRDTSAVNRTETSFLLWNCIKRNRPVKPHQFSEDGFRVLPYCTQNSPPPSRVVTPQRLALTGM